MTRLQPTTGKIVTQPMEKSNQARQPAILLFDGVCNLCNGFVQFVLLRDPTETFKFASLQSDFGRQKMAELGLNPEQLDTVIMVENGKAYTHSDVPLRVVRKMPGLWPLLSIFVIIPKFIRDPIYNWIARNRYRWFGKRKSCMLPRPEWKDRFLG